MKVGFTCGVFDLFHAGHVLMFQECKRHCDYLIVAINKAENIDPHINPGKNQPIYPYSERQLILEHCGLVDEVLGYNSEDELIDLLKSREIHIRFLGDDYRNRPITGQDLVPEIHYTDRSHGLSSSRVRDLVKGKTS